MQIDLPGRKPLESSVFVSAKYSAPTTPPDFPVFVVAPGQVYQPTPQPQPAPPSTPPSPPNNQAYVRMIKVDNSNNSTSLTNYPVLVILDTESLISAGKMRSDCGDIRIIDVNGTVLPYWIERGCNAADTTIWVKVPYIPAFSTVYLYLYYGNSSVTSASNGYNVFDFFDDFTTYPPNSSICGQGGWTCFGNPSTSVTTDEVWFYTNAKVNGIYRSSPISSGLAIRCAFSPNQWAAPSDYIGIILNSDTDFENRPNSYYFDLYCRYITTLATGWSLKIIKRNNGADTTLTEAQYAVGEASVTKVIEARRFGSKLGMYGAYPPTPSEAPYCTVSDAWYPMPYFGFQVTENITGVLNYILVRKYVEPEPTTSVGPEQTI
jgi:hypothetical protein